MRKFLVCLVAVFFLFGANLPFSNGYAREIRTPIFLLFTSSGMLEFNTATGKLSESQKEAGTPSRFRGTQSPAGDKLIYWDIQKLESPVVQVVRSNNGLSTFQISLLAKTKIEFLRATWPNGNRFVVLEGGMYVDGAPYSAQPIQQTKFRWMLDTEKISIAPWYWKCSQIVRLRLQNSSQLALTCHLDKDIEVPNGTAPHILFSNEGTVSNQDSFDLIYKQNPIYAPIWSFSQTMAGVVYVDYSEGILKEKIVYYELASGTLRIIETTDEPIVQLNWSPSSKYSVFFKQCKRISTCVEIRDGTTFKTIWNSSSLGEKLLPMGVVWSLKETEMYLLGYEQQSAKIYIWGVDLLDMSVFAKWSVPLDTYYFLLNQQ